MDLTAADWVISSAGCGYAVSIIYLQISKAYDKFPHVILASKLVKGWLEVSRVGTIHS